MINMQCELCGRDCFECRPAVVDGVRMMLCPGCMRYGEAVSGGVEAPVVVQNLFWAGLEDPRLKMFMRE